MLFDAIREQHLLERIAIFLTTVVLPMLIELGFGLVTIGPCWDCMNLSRGAIYFVTFPIALAVIALASYVNWSKVKKKLNENASELEGSINQLRQDHEKKISRDQNRFDDLHDWVNALRESIEAQSEMKLPVPAARIRGDITSGVPTMSGAPHTRPPEGRMARLRYWRSLLWLRFRSWYRKYIDSKDNN